MGLFARIQPAPQPEPEAPGPQPEPARPRKSWSLWARLWFGWWVFGCVALLAWNAQQQLAIQQRILARSEELERIVAEAAAVSADTNRQLLQVEELDAATARLGAKLKEIGAVNGAIKQELKAIEAAVGETIALIDTMAGQAELSQERLMEIARLSAELHTVLRQSQQIGADVSLYLQRLVEIQEGVNADLSAMNANTRFLER